MNQATQTLPHPALSQLKDIHLPDPVSWWPLAFSWWVVIFAVVGMALFIIWFFWQKHKRNAYRREAVANLKQLEHAWLQKQLTSSALLAQLNRLLKQVALTAYGRHEVSVLSDQAWLNFLQKRAAFLMQPPCSVDLMNSLYQKNTDYEQADIQSWLSYSRQWIEKHHY